MSRKINVISLGSGNEKQLTFETLEIIKNANKIVLRTAIHPVVSYLNTLNVLLESYDSYYETQEDFTEINNSIVNNLLEKSKEEEEVYYAVSDATLDETVKCLLINKPEDCTVKIIAGVSHIGRCLSLLKTQTGSMRYYSATEFPKARLTPEEDLFIYEMYCKHIASECKIALMELYPEECEIWVFYGDPGTGEITTKACKLFQLDRLSMYNHMSAVYVPKQEREKRSRYDLQDLCDIMEILRGENGCPWDREQTYSSILPSLLEESYEYIQAVRDEDYEHMADELGDILLQVAFHSQMAKEQGEFNITDVTSYICEKMIERHTHIFGNVNVENSEDVIANWEKIKKEQRGIKTLYQSLQDISLGLSPMLRASKVLKKVEKELCEVTSIDKIIEYIKTLLNKLLQTREQSEKIDEEIGYILFTMIRLCNFTHVNPDISLQKITDCFIESQKNR